MERRWRFAVGAAALIGIAGSAGAQNPCGSTTRDGMFRDLDGDGQLECAPGELPWQVREELATADPGRDPVRLAAFFTLADFQLADEESPLRGEWADKCGSLPTAGAFRPQETMVPHLLNAHVRAANQIAAAGSPRLDGPFDFVISLGDLADNQHYNETRLFIDILDGSASVDPDSGADGYEGVQGSDPQGAGDLASPVAGVSILDLANEPFEAVGLRVGENRIPWYSVIGNHDMKVQGTVTDLPGWREFARAWAVGSIKVTDLAPDHQQKLCANPALLGDPAFWMMVAASPGTTKVITPDPDRQLLDKAEWMAEHGDTTGIPTGHGFDESTGTTRCRDTAGSVLDRACYSFTQGDFLYLALDTTAAEGLENGNIDDPQFQWLERTLVDHSSTYYDAAGAVQSNPGATDKLIVVFTHHTISSTQNQGLPITHLVPGVNEVGAAYAAAQGFHQGEELKALLLRFPNVILQASGHTHQNKVWGHPRPVGSGGYWEVNTAAIVDYPQQSRVIEIADNGDCTLSVFATVFDADVDPNPRNIEWAIEDPTPGDDINEDWLASAALEVGFHDPQGDLAAIGTVADRNVELLVETPAWLCGP